MLKNGVGCIPVRDSAGTYGNKNHTGAGEKCSPSACVAEYCALPTSARTLSPFTPNDSSQLRSYSMHISRRLHPVEPLESMSYQRCWFFGSCRFEASDASIKNLRGHFDVPIWIKRWTASSTIDNSPVNYHLARAIVNCAYPCTHIPALHKVAGSTERGQSRTTTSTWEAIHGLAVPRRMLS